MLTWLELGSHILSTLLKLPTISTIKVTASSPLRVAEIDRVRIVLDTSIWTKRVARELEKRDVNAPSIILSAPSKTIMRTGDWKFRREVKVSLILALARMARQTGCRVYVPTSNANPVPPTTSLTKHPCGLFKRVLERAVAQLAFEHLVLVQPELLKILRTIMGNVARFFHSIGGGYLGEIWTLEADVIEKAVVVAGMRCLARKALSGQV
ncbi:MAG: Protein fmp52, mitochondrial [Pycnora praestabilis]|nr:MAG: Protein fmp52, mitochondrial [Pycnora praestabilis]